MNPKVLSGLIFSTMPVFFTLKAENLPETTPYYLLYDGFCVLCSRSVQWLLRRDNHARFRFIPQQSPEGQKILAQAGLHVPKITTESPAPADSVILVAGNDYYTESDAAIRAVTALGGWYRLAGLLRIVPKFLRNPAYRLIAKNRFRWFGRRNSCYLPERHTDN